MNELVENCKPNRTAKIPLKEITEYFKDKAVSRLGDSDNILVINLSDMDDTGIDYVHLKEIDCGEKSVSHYLSQEGDMLIVSKGTVKEVAVFTEQDEPVIALANITVLHPTSDILGGCIRLFLASDLGQVLLGGTNTGENVVNLSTQKIISAGTLRVSSVRQAYLIQGYGQDLKDYKHRLGRAKQKW